MTVDEDFQMWVAKVVPPRDEHDPGFLPAGTDQLLREIFDRRGLISVEGVRVEGRDVQMNLAQQAVALVLRDLYATTKARPIVELSHDDEYGLIVKYNGGWSTPAISALRHPEATSEIADYLQGEIVEDADIWSGWPTCPIHSNGLYAETIAGQALWYCRYGTHRVAVIGELAP
jgi:hypothetical protein